MEALTVKQKSKASRDSDQRAVATGRALSPEGLLRITLLKTLVGVRISDSNKSTLPTKGEEKSNPIADAATKLAEAPLPPWLS